MRFAGGPRLANIENHKFYALLRKRYWMSGDSGQGTRLYYLEPIF